MKDNVARFFDSTAKDWDKINKPASEILEKIADIAGISENLSVLDVGCGTGVMFPFYLKRNVKSLTAVDVSEEMLRIAQKKFPGESISFVQSDIVNFDDGKRYDCVITHNAFPHFLRQREATEKLKALTSPGGTLTVAHSISRENVLKCHENIPDISLELPEARTLADMFGEEFEAFTILSDEKCYIVSARKKEKKERGNFL